MKKIYALLVISIALLLQFCATTKKTAPKSMAVAKITYVSNIQPLLLKNCSPCHFPPEGKKKALNTYIAAKTEIDDILESIKKNPGEKGFMPFKHSKLSDSVIHVYAQWKTDGLLEK